MKDANANRCGKEFAFTLVELLVVIAIFGVLASLLLPALNRAKVSALGAQCVNNHRQLILAWTMYCHDSDDQLPRLDSWVVGYMKDPFDATNAALLVDTKESILARYVSNSKIYKCPRDRSPLVRSVSMNCFMNSDPTGMWLSGQSDRYLIFTKLQHFRKPSETFVILDERSDSINDAAFVVDMSNTGSPEGTGTSTPYWIIDFPASYHNKAACLSFADGHVESHRWLDSTTLVPPGQIESHTAPANQDAKWLQDHCTSLK